MSTSHEPAYAEDGMPKERYRLYHREKAIGGVGLTMIGGSAVVAPDSPPSFGNLLLYKDEIVPWLRRLTDDVHEAGAAVMCQVTHLGRRTSNFTGDWLPLVYASPLREPAHRSFPKVAEPWDLDRIVADYAAAAQRCVAAGLDGIELQSYGHLFDAFHSPATNHRDDDLGGRLEARLSFPRRIVKAVRAAVGPDFVVGIRMSMDEDSAGALGRDEALQALECYVGDGIDFLSVIKGTIDRDATLARVIPSMGTPSAPFLDFAGEIRRTVGIPVMHASRISDVATARHAIRDGLLDLVGMTRPQMADPHLVAKVAAGEEDRIRPCVGANYCLDAIYQSGDAKCIHNAATGREETLHHVLPLAPARRKVVVVGAGPAGLEAARVLGERGHQVVVL
ncbi:MAG TPA: N-methylproline demethylase, partial [Dermatophilaceae bacterium]|nr:N-methylproline demethylase [Dermatophilaceae bacterium]